MTILVHLHIDIPKPLQTKRPPPHVALNLHQINDVAKRKKKKFNLGTMRLTLLE
jgi:hypothetical protein